MARLTTRNLYILGAADERFAPSAITAKGAGNTDSAYTEASARPGTAVTSSSRSMLTPRVSGAQDETLTLRVQRGGMPGREGVELSYQGATDSQRRCWSSPFWANRWVPIQWTTSNKFLHTGVAVVPGSQKVIVVYSESTGSAATSGLRCKVWDPSTQTLGAEVEITDDEYNHFACCALPNGRVLVLAGDIAAGRMYYSDDAGATWASYAVRTDPGGFESSTRMSMAYHRGDLALVQEEATSRIVQYASSDMGATWVEVWDSGTSFGTYPSVASSPDGALFLAYMSAANNACVRRVAAAFESFGDVDDVLTNTFSGQTSTSICTDTDGSVWFSVAGQGDVVTYLSTDGGDTWDAAASPSGGVAGDSGTGIINLSTCWTGGQLLVAHAWDNSHGSDERSCAFWLLGGWSNVVNGYYSADDDSEDLSLYNRAWNSSASWWPEHIPGSYGWTKTGAASDSIVSDGKVEYTIATNTCYWTQGMGTASDLTGCIMGEVEVVAGSSWSSTTANALIRLRVSSGSVDYEVDVRCSDVAARVYDVNAGTQLGTTLTVDMTTAMQFLIVMDTASCQVYYRRPTAVAWTQWVTSTTLTSGVETTSQAVFGNLASATSGTVRYRFVTAKDGNVRVHYTADSETMPSRPAAVLPTAIPEHGSSTMRCFLGAEAGPGFVGESFTVSPRYDYPVSAALAVVSPTPSRKWRATDTSEVKLVFDLGANAASHLGRAPMLAVMQPTFQEATLQYWTGAAWTTVATVNTTRVSSTAYTLSGDVLAPNGNGATYLLENELAGGIAVINTKARRIRGNTAGWWSSSASHQARVFLDGIDGTESASSSGTLHVPNAVGVGLQSTLTTARYWRIRIASGQYTPEGYYEAGLLCPFFGRTVGQDPSWGWSDERAGNVERTRDRRGGQRAYKLGPTQRTLQVDWQDPQAWRQLRGSAEADYLGSSTVPLAGRDDVYGVLAGMMREAPHLPWVFAANVPEAGGSLVKAEQLIIGHVTSSIQASQVQGDEGTDEVIRTQGVVIEELV